MQFHVRWGQSEPPSPTCHRNSRRSGTLFKGETKMQNFARFMGIPALALIATVLMASNPPSVAAEGDGMFDLVKFEATEAGSPATREQAIELLDKLVVPSLEKLAKEGRIRAGGLLVGARAGVVVVAEKSHDEGREFVRALPAWGIWNWKVTPLESFAHRADLEKKVVQELRGAENGEARG